MILLAAAKINSNQICMYKWKMNAESEHTKYRFDLI